MFNPSYNTSQGQYSPTKETFPLINALSVAVAVDRNQGFLKANQGYYDSENECRVDDNRTSALRTLRATLRGDTHSADGKEIKITVVTDADRLKAKEIYDHFDQSLLMEKLGDNLVKIGSNGRRNDFNESLSKMFDKDKVDVNKELAMLVSLPNSFRISLTRDRMNEFNKTHRENGYIGAMKDRIKIAGHVIDVKPIPHHAIHLATVETTDGQVAKFFMNDKLSDLAKSINGTDIVFVGTVKKQEVNPYTECQETVFNRVKIEL